MPLERQLAARREQLGLSLRTVSRRSGLSHTHIRDIERGMRRPGSLDTLRRLSNALNCTIVVVINAGTVRGYLG